MITRILAGGALVLSLIGTGCATKKYVTQSITPVDNRVAVAETKNAEQDKQLAAQTARIEEVDRDLSRTKERVTDTDAKAAAAGDAAKRADEKAVTAQRTAGEAATAAEGAKSFAANGLNQLERTVDATNTFRLAKSETVLFKLNRWVLTDEAKQQLREFAQASTGLNRYMIEVQGFTDKTGSADYNKTLSEQRAHEVARYLNNEFKIPVRSITILGSGYAQPVGNDKTGTGRKQNRRVEVRLFVPQAATAVSGAPTGN
jgi:outer membrane protein OmpA-like peptidoglycan-associated protein